MTRLDNELLKTRFGHIGKIFFNLTIACGVLSLICLLSPFITALYALIVFAVAVVAVCFTLGLIFLIAPDFISGLFSSLSDMDKILSVVVKILDYSLPIMTVVAVLAAVMFILQTNRRKMVVASIVLAIVAGLTWAFVASGLVETMQ
ncbi:MAG: hypothetical protein ACI4MY_05415 [Christensenellales bacterium]